MNKIKGFKKTFILGGTRSGKSDFALEKANQAAGLKAFIATAQPLDSEMKKRIEQHKLQRECGWKTYEEPIDISEVLFEIADRYQVIILDCLTLWINNLMANEHIVNIEERFLLLKETLENLNQQKGQDITRIYIVSNEVGMGIVPENTLARRFRDLAGSLNRMVAKVADEVYLVYAGLPLLLKG